MKIFRKILAAVLVLSLLCSFVGCAKLEEFFAGEKPADTNDGDIADLIGEIDPRVPGNYNFLLVREGYEAGSASSFTLCQMSLSKSTLNFLQIPTNLFIREEGVTRLSEIYEKAYDKAFSLGLSADECEVNAAKAISATLADNLSLPVDYHIVISKDSFVNYVDFMGGLKLSLSFDFTTEVGITYPAGNRTLEGEVAFEFIEYQFFRDRESEYNAAREMLAAVHKYLTSTLSSENISIHMVQAKPMFATDIPTKDGYDIFFLRKLIEVTPENWSVTNLCTTPVSLSTGDYEVIRYSAALEQLNSFLAVYETPIRSNLEETKENDKLLDPEKKLTDEDHTILNNMYKAESKTLPDVYSASDIYTGKLGIFRQ